MKEADLFRQYAKEAMRWSSLPPLVSRYKVIWWVSQLAAGYNRACAFLRGPELRGSRLGYRGRCIPDRTRAAEA